MVLLSQKIVREITKRKDWMNTMKEPRGRLVLRTALISALALSVISASAIFLGASAAEPALDSVDTGIALSEEADVVQDPEVIEAPSEENEETEMPEDALPAQDDETETPEDAPPMQDDETEMPEDALPSQEETSDAAETVSEQTVTDQVSNNLDEAVPTVVKRRILMTPVSAARLTERCRRNSITSL